MIFKLQQYLIYGQINVTMKIQETHIELELVRIRTRLQSDASQFVKCHNSEVRLPRTSF